MCRLGVLGVVAPAFISVTAWRISAAGNCLAIAVRTARWRSTGGAGVDSALAQDAEFRDLGLGRTELELGTVCNGIGGGDQRGGRDLQLHEVGRAARVPWQAIPPTCNCFSGEDFALRLGEQGGVSGTSRANCHCRLLASYRPCRRWLQWV